MTPIVEGPPVTLPSDVHSFLMNAYLTVENDCIDLALSVHLRN